MGSGAFSQAATDAERVRAALTGLCSTQREVVELAYFGGHSDDQLAAELAVSVETAKAWLRDGLLQLRGILLAVG
jgi:RNA polymerase sigma-70 factor, ECF subfamily